jgi:malonyl-CoA O-methyltransferase
MLPDKRALRRAYARVARDYEQAAFVDREIAGRMHERLGYIKHEPARVLDAGSGTCLDGPRLAQRYPNAHIVHLDLSTDMLRAPRVASSWWKRHLPFMGNTQPAAVCGDLEALPIAAGSIGLVWSNLALHLCDLDRALVEMHRVLAVGGLAMFTTFGPDTLKELREACAGLDAYEHVQRFIDMHDVGDALVRAGFADPVMDMEMLTVTFDDFAAIARDMKAGAATYYAATRNPGLMGRKRWRRMIERYEAQRRDGKLPVTLEVVYGHAWKPAPRSTADGRQIVEFRTYRRS